MPWMIKEDRRKDIPSDAVDVWAESGWELESPPLPPIVKTPPVKPMPTDKDTSDK